METNREKYIDKLSDKELGILLSNKCYIGPDGKIKVEPIEETEGDSMEIYKWLSQEAEEDKDIENDGSLDFIIKKIQRIHDRLYKLEKNVKDLNFDDSEYCHMSHELRKRVEKLEKYSLVGRDLILTELKPQYDITLKQKSEKNSKEDTIHDIITFDGHSCGEVEIKTANQMFEDLGYKQDNANINHTVIKYIDGNIVIEIDKVALTYAKFEKESFTAMLISNEEDAAIHKKIEELKNERHHK